MGLTVYVYRNALGDSTNGGVSAKVDQLTLVNVDGPFEPKPHAPAALLLPNHYGTVKIVPADEDGKPVAGWHMNGGNIASSSDSRFGEAVCKLTGAGMFCGGVPIHDRFE